MDVAQMLKSVLVDTAGVFYVPVVIFLLWNYDHVSQQ